ncbi:MAG: alpha-galactosidase [Erysipelotrichaceae bacterium]|nr:alpha-galactosidase [Erysipelotrichaceae bacterium]
MPIIYDKKKRVFHLYNKDISYLIYISLDSRLIHLHFGAHLKDYDLDTMIYHTTNYYTHFDGEKEHISSLYDFNYETSLMELASFNKGDYRSCSIKIKNHNGDETTDFTYVSHKIYKGKQKLEGLPCLKASEDDVTTLEIKLIDKAINVVVILQYNILTNYPVITRSMKVINQAEDEIILKKAYSATLDLKTSDYNLYYLSGRYGKERNVCKEKIMQGCKVLSSIEGKSSHNTSPFIALASLDACEDYGEVYSCNFIYSGNFEIKVEVDKCEFTRVLVGINPETFEYVLEKNQSFQTPEVILLYTNKGIGEMSRIYHKVINNHLISSNFLNMKRPVLLNSWEGCYFDFDTDKILKIIDEAHQLGIEMFVLDDGWFAKRNDDNSSLGDWYVNNEKVDLNKVEKRLRQYNMKFGLWFEPEMISYNSSLYKNHKDYAIKCENRDYTLMRHQMVLDMSRQDVCDNIYKQMSDIIDKYHIDYIKWDHNRSITEAYSKHLDSKHMGEFYHRFMLGTYSILERLNNDYPSLFIESCCGGGGRYDAGMLYYSPQIWTSDETDAIERLSIQEGTSFCFPCSSMGSHVSANQRTSYKTKAYVALQGTFGYELDPLKLDDETKALIKKQIKTYHEFYDLTHYGDLYYLIRPSNNAHQASWMFVSQDKKRALFTYVVTLKNKSMLTYIKLKGLKENKYYYCKEKDKTYYGKFLMEVGLDLTFDYIYSYDSIMLSFIEK